MFRTVCWAVCGVICATLFARAQSPPDLLEQLQNPLSETTAPSSATVRGESFPTEPGLIVTTTGGLIEGKIQRTTGGYMVQRGGGYLHIPFQSIKMTAVNRHDAYRKYRELMPEKTPKHHVTLAKWCLTNQLHNDAIVELQAALALDSQYAEAVNLMKSLEAMQYRQTDTAPVKFGADESHDDELRVVSLFGLSAETIGEYTSAIQPILMNNCANAGCHNHTADNDLKLRYVRLTGYSNRLWSKQNLASVLTHVDVEHPEQSPLSRFAGDLHAGPHKSLRNTLQGKEMLARIDRWIATVAREQRSESVAKSTSKSNSPQADSPASTTSKFDAFDPHRFNTANSK